MISTAPRWWMSGVIYQIYPRSFLDTNGDGVGDLEGIRRGLPYLSWLGVDAIWISPIYPSPMADFGYDIADFCDIDPRFGSLDTLDALIREAHDIGLKVILDYVPNHTSDQHPWFREACRSRDDPKRDFYLWREPGDGGGVPNNWLSEFGGPAWTWEPRTRQFYYHAYLAAQPDLNWRNPEVRRAMLDVLTFWLDRGVDGFRVDTIHHLIKDAQFRDNPPNPEYSAGMPPSRSLVRVYTTDRPEVQQAVGEMRAVLDRYAGDRVLIGEAYLPIERLVAYYGVELRGMHLPFNFHLIHARWEAESIAAIARAYEAALPAGAWPNWVLGNHDRSRIATRVGARQARLAALLLLTLRGTPTLYYGDEIGMSDVAISAEQIRDPWEKNVPGRGLGRDPERTPMQWSAGPQAGFTRGEPWLPVASDSSTCNVETEKASPASMLSFERGLLALRRRHPALSLGAFEVLDLGRGSPNSVLGYLRTHGPARFGVLLNFSATPQRFAAPSVMVGAEMVLSTEAERPRQQLGGEITLAADEGILVEVAGPER